MSSVKEAFIKPFPNSNKIYVEGSRPDIQVPMREITLTDTIGELAEKTIQFMFMILLAFIQIQAFKLIYARVCQISVRTGLMSEQTLKC